MKAAVYNQNKKRYFFFKNSINSQQYKKDFYLNCSVKVSKDSYLNCSLKVSKDSYLNCSVKASKDSYLNCSVKVSKDSISFFSSSAEDLVQAKGRCLATGTLSCLNKTTILKSLLYITINTKKNSNFRGIKKRKLKNLFSKKTLDFYLKNDLTLE